ncbi:MAG: hypothetical protein JST92_14345 [Deltaproteobacteria bacterium]|nr:hypothetical protein [Deltaproteobacteria bacterium]
MRLQNAPGLNVPQLAALLISAGVLAGCPAGVDVPTPTGNPTVTRIYAVDTGVGTLPDVLLYSSTEPTKVSPKMPTGWAGLRVEFDRPMKGSSMVTNGGFPDIETSGTNPPSGSYCAPLSSPVIALVDVDTPTNDMSKLASICYDSSSALLGNPSITIVLQTGAALGSGTPFTCNVADIDGGNYVYGASTGLGGNPLLGLGYDVWKPNHAYGIKFTASSITDNAGNALSAPTDAGWASGQFGFTTMGLEILAMGYQDPNTGYYSWQSKNPGFMKDLSAQGDAFVVPSDDAPATIVFSGLLSDPSKGGADVNQDLNVDVTRADGSNQGGYSLFHLLSGFVAGVGYEGDSRQIDIYPAEYFESGSEVKAVVSGGIKGINGTTLGTDTTFQFKTGARDNIIRDVLPASGAVAQSLQPANLIGCGGVTFNLFTQEAVDPALLTSDHIKLYSVDANGNETEVTNTSIDACIDQIIDIASNDDLLPDTTYVVKTTGLKTATGAGYPNPGKDIPDFTSSFHTQTFRSVNIYNGSVSSLRTLDRRAAVDPVHLFDCTLLVYMAVATDPATMTPANVVLNELTTNSSGQIATTAVSAAYTVTPTDATNQTFAIKVTDTSYPLKYGQRYQVKLSTNIKSVSGVSLKAEGCTSGDCSDSRTFITSTPYPRLRWSRIDTTSGAFKIEFAYDSFTNTHNSPTGAGAFKADHSSDIASAVKLYQQANDGSLSNVDVTCAALAADDSSTSVTCTPNAALTPDTRFLYSVAFTSDKPLKMAATRTVGSTTYTTDSASGKYVGSATKAFRTDCP